MYGLAAVELVSLRHSSCPGDSVAGLWKDCELIPLSPGFNYPEAHGFKDSCVHKSSLD